MKISIYRKIFLTILCIACGAIYFYEGDLLFKAISPVERSTEILFGEILYWGFAIYASLMGIKLNAVYSGLTTQSSVIETALLGVLIIPFFLIYFCSYGIAILIGIFLASGLLKII